MTKRPFQPVERNAPVRPATRTRANANVTADVYSEAAADRLAFWERQAERLTWDQRWDQVLDWSRAHSPTGLPADAERGVQLRRPARGRGPRHQVASTGRASPVTSGAHLRRALGRGVPGGQRPGGAGRAGRRPGGAVHADDPGDRDRDARLRPAGRAARVVLGGFSAEALRGRILDCDARVVITADSSFQQGSRGCPEAGSRRSGGGLPGRPGRPGGAPHRPAPVAFTEGRDVWWHEVVDRQSPEHPGAGVRRRAPALHHVHLRHHRPPQGHPAHQRRLPDPGRLVALGGL